MTGGSSGLGVDFARELAKRGANVRLMLMKSETVARIGIDAMLAGRRSVVPGLGNKISAFFVRLIPRRMATWIAWLTMKDGGEGYSA